MHVVKCVYCDKKFDRDTEKYQVISNRRYAHLNCHEPVIDTENITASTISKYATKILGSTAKQILISKQTKDFVARGLTYRGIYLTLKYWYEVKNNPIEKANGGIGIVPYVYEEAKKHWQENKPVEDVRVPKIEVEHVVIKRKPRKKLLIETEE